MGLVRWSGYHAGRVACTYARHERFGPIRNWTDGRQPKPLRRTNAGSGHEVNPFEGCVAIVRP